MKLSDIANIRLASQLISRSRFDKVKDVVGWMGAMQAQDYAMVKWAVGLRLPDGDAQIVERAISDGEIIRTHLLRPTWHLVSSDDIYWMLELTAPRIRTGMKSRHRVLGLTESLLKRSNETIAKALEGKQLNRAELISELEKAGIRTTGDNRASHMFRVAELAGIICSGASDENKETYALLSERVPKATSLSREAALAALARKYFNSHCPATLNDFIWWSGLSVREAKQALDLVKPDFIRETIASQNYWLPHSCEVPEASDQGVWLLPAFDEYLISYKDRSASLPFKDFNKTVSNNGVFRPVVVVNGGVKGIWKRTIKKDRVVVETELFCKLGKTTLGKIEEEAAKYGRFLGREVEISHRLA
jgi:hypothetical protein